MTLSWRSSLYDKVTAWLNRHRLLSFCVVSGSVFYTLSVSVSSGAT